MIYDRSASSNPDWQGFPEFEKVVGPDSDRVGREGIVLDASPDFEDFTERRDYDRDLVESVWEFAEIVRGNDSALWRKDEFGQWICRADFGKRYSEFGWEIFDPGVGRHTQGVYAMRPMQWKSFLRQYDTFD